MCAGQNSSIWVSHTVHETGARWNGALREQVFGTGISVAPAYYGELFTNTRGGISTNDATQYQALLDLPLTFDFERLQVPLAGKFFLLGTEHAWSRTDGRFRRRYAGAQQYRLVQECDASQRVLVGV